MPIYEFCSECRDMKQLKDCERIDDLHIISELVCGHFKIEHEASHRFTKEGTYLIEGILEKEKMKENGE